MNDRIKLLLQQIWCKIKQLEDSGTGIQSIQPGTNITVDNTDPLNPIVSATGEVVSGLESVVEGENISIDYSDPQNPIISSTGGSSVWESDMLLGYAFGKYAAGSTLPSAGKTDEEIIRDAYQGILDAVIVNPTFGLSRSNSGTTVAEVGSTLNFSLTGTYNPGGIYGKMISGSWQTASTETNKQADRAGSLASMTLDGEVFTDLVNPKTVSIARVVSVGVNNINGSASFLQGTDKPKRSDGTEYGSVYTTPLIISSSTTPITGLLPYFYGFINDGQTIDNIDISTLTKVVANSTGTISIAYSGITGKRLVILIPSTSTLKTKWFVNTLNSGSIGNPGDLFPSVQTRNYNSPTGLWTTQSFRVYISNTTNLNETIQLQN